MDIQFSFLHMGAGEETKEFVTVKSEKLKKYFHGKIHVKWTFKEERGQIVAHCHLLGNHMDYFAEATNPDLRTAVEESLDRLDKQLKKHKEIVKNHHHASPDHEAIEHDSEE